MTNHELIYLAIAMSGTSLLSSFAAVWMAYVSAKRGEGPAPMAQEAPPQGDPVPPQRKPTMMWIQGG